MENSTDRELLTTEEVAAWLRADVRYIYWLNYIGKGPKRHKVGRRLLYRRSDVESWLKQRAVEE